MTRQRSRRRPTGEHEKLDGWAAVEEDLLEHDEGTMQAHAGDVDTLLVFAGLFSAVLTAFVVESYQQLQVDTDQKSMFLLQRISIQLESFTLSPGFANCSSKTPLPSLDFMADITARWINILWFLSLIFGLAAALFGILVKQWIREYMQWNSALASPRENVLVRQIRFEAWNKWNVPATIAAVPALLEIALVLFVCGLVVLLWTLDAVVSIVITTAVAVFLAAASTFIVLPAFFVRCPYKSPTAWACAFVWDIFTLWIPHSIARSIVWLMQNIGVLQRTGRIGFWVWRKCKYVCRRMTIWKPFAADWRQRDLAAVWTSPVTQTRRGDVAPLLQELLRLEQAPTDASQAAEGEEPQYDVSHIWVQKNQRVPIHNAIRTITEFPPLVRALGWVSQASQDARTQQNVSHCIQALESHFVLPNPIHLGLTSVTQDSARILSIWYFVSSASPDAAEALGLGEAERSITAIRRRAHDQCSQTFHSIYGQEVPESRGILPELHVLLQVLALSVKSLVDRLAQRPFDNSADVHLYAQRAREQLGVILPISLYQTDNTLPLQSAAHYLMEALRISDGHICDSFESAFPYLRWHIFQAAKWLRNDGTPWSLLEELHVLIPPEANYGYYHEFQPIKRRQTHPANIPLPPSPSTSASSLAPKAHHDPEFVGEPLRASSSSPRNAMGEGSQSVAGQSQDSGADSAAPGEGVLSLTKHGDTVGYPEDPGVDCTTAVPQPPRSCNNGSGSNGHGDAVADDQEDPPVPVGPHDLAPQNAGTTPQQLAPVSDTDSSLSDHGGGENVGRGVDGDPSQDLEAGMAAPVPQCLSRGSIGSESQGHRDSQGDIEGGPSHPHDSTPEIQESLPQ